ncbi:hypothetical protein PISMIDRAFT_47966, partial [Pisolithus microcarpus 441]
VSRIALECNEQMCDEYQLAVSEEFSPSQLVFVDESACSRVTLRRPMAWSHSGTRAHRQEHFVWGKWYSVLPTISLDGILHLDIQDCAYTAVSFNQFIDVLLNNMNPFPQNNSVIVMDNVSIHKSPELKHMI